MATRSPSPRASARPSPTSSRGSHRRPTRPTGATNRPHPPSPGYWQAVITNALTVDLEDWYHGIELPPERWREFEDRRAGSCDRLLSLLDEAGVSATFFVLGDVAERQPQRVRAIAAEGHA